MRIGSISVQETFGRTLGNVLEMLFLAMKRSFFPVNSQKKMIKKLFISYSTDVYLEKTCLVKICSKLKKKHYRLFAGDYFQQIESKFFQFLMYLFLHPPENTVCSYANENQNNNYYSFHLARAMLCYNHADFYASINQDSS